MVLRLVGVRATLILILRGAPVLAAPLELVHRQLILIRYTVGIGLLDRALNHRLGTGVLINALAQLIERQLVDQLSGGHLVRELALRQLVLRQLILPNLILGRQRLIGQQLLSLRLHARPPDRLHHAAGRARGRRRPLLRRGRTLDGRGPLLLIHPAPLVKNALPGHRVLRRRHVLRYLPVSQPLEPRLPEIGRELFRRLLGQLRILSRLLGRRVGQLGPPSRRRRSRYRDVRLLKSYLARPLGRAHRCLYPLAELGRSDKEQMLLLLAGDQHVVLVLALLLAPVAERRHPVTVLPVVEPLALVSKPVAPLRYTETRPLVVLPLAQIRLRHRGVHLLVLPITNSGD